MGLSGGQTLLPESSSGQLDWSKGRPSIVGETVAVTAGDVAAGDVATGAVAAAAGSAVAGIAGAEVTTAGDG
jgi:hypothetical protein